MLSDLLKQKQNYYVLNGYVKKKQIKLTMDEGLHNKEGPNILRAGNRAFVRKVKNNKYVISIVIFQGFRLRLPESETF